MILFAEATYVKVDDFEEKSFFTPFELEHILQLPLVDIVELFAKVPKVDHPRGCYQGAACREMIAKLARKRVYADIIARNAVNADPEIRRGEDSGQPLEIGLLDCTKDYRFTVRFPGDLRNYLDDSRTSPGSDPRTEVEKQE